MKTKIKTLISEIIKYQNVSEPRASIQNLSIFISVIIATLSLRLKQSNQKIDTTYHTYKSDFKPEFQKIYSRFPELINTFKSTELELKREFIFDLFENIKKIFDEIDADFDDLISWSYQYLKKDLEKTAFRKIGKNQEKIRDIDLLYTTQFFTDRYMVEYLVDESLTKINKKDLQQIIIIDPASGGGNFLNCAFEKLFTIYKKTKPNYSNQKIVDLILNNSILGYDLDHNLSKIACLSLFIKACSYATPSDSTQINIFGGVPDDKLGYLNSEIISNSINKTNFLSQLQETEKEKKIKVFLTNPPFMGKRDMDVTLKDFLLVNYPESKGDLCASFIQRIMQTMNKKDVLGVVSQNNWMYLSSFREFRYFFLKTKTLLECVDLGSKAFADINGEKTSIALCVIGEEFKKKSRFFNLKFKNFNEKRTSILHKKFSDNLTYELNQNLFLTNSHYEFNYQLQHGFKNIQRLKKYSEYAKPMQGTSTGNNSKFVKYAWEVNGNPDWKLVSKGGGFSRWVGLNFYKVHWGENAEVIKANEGSALRNIDKIPLTQLVFSDTGTLGLNVRLLKENQVFIASGPGIQVFEGDMYAHLAFLNSRIATFLLKLINPKFTVSAGYIAKIPIAENILDSRYIAEKSKQCSELKEKYLQNKLPNFEFHHYDYSNIKDVSSFIEKSIIDDLESDYQRLCLESQIELEINKQFNFNTKELFEIKNVVGESPIFNTNNTIKLSTKELDLLLASSIDLNCLSTSRTINGYSIGSESVLENISYKFGVNPKAIFDFIKRDIYLLYKTKDKYFNDLLHKIILYELGVEQVSIYQSSIINIESLVLKIGSKYSFLKQQLNLTQSIVSILNVHHKSSFFNKPLATIVNKSITVGQVHNA